MATFTTISNIALLCTLGAFIGNYSANNKTINQQSSFEVLSVKTDDYNTGTAIVKDQFNTISIVFAYTAHDDSFGPVGSHFESHSIEMLEISKIQNKDGQAIPDYMDHQDILQLKAQITAQLDAGQ